MLLFADYETYWDRDYTLRKMTPAEYILDRRFQAHGMAVQMGELGNQGWVEGCNLNQYFDVLKRYRANGGKVTMVTYNALFDMCITAWMYDFVPDMMIDVLGMARATYGMMLKQLSLAKVAEYLNLGESKGDWVGQVMGMRTEDIKRVPGLWEQGKDYAKKDVRLMVGIFRHIMPSFPRRELAVMDLVLRTTVQPQFIYDRPLLEQHLAETIQHKADLLASCGLTYDEFGKCPDLMSAVKFKAILEGMGVAVEEKQSLTTGKMLPALAKTDAFMQNLLEDPDERIATLAAARLGHKSTLEETRCQRFINIASLPSSPGFRAGSAPIPLRYGAAHTHRIGGDWKLNKQNMPRKSKLRKSLKVADDEIVITADEAQIEARLSAWLAKETTLLREFTEGLDPYGQLGANIFGLPAPVKGDKDWRKIHHPLEGFIGKTGILGLGYGAGHPKFFTMCTSSARMFGMGDIVASGVFSPALAEKSVNTYRARYHRLPACWRFLNNDGMAALLGNQPSAVLAPVIIRKGVIWGPNGQRMFYPDLRRDPATGETTYQQGVIRSKIYGAKLLENITQWLARNIVMEAAVRLYYKYGLRFALQAHDELVFIVKKDRTEWARSVIKLEMERRPEWAPDLPLEVEVNQGANYGEAK